MTEVEHDDENATNPLYLQGNQTCAQCDTNLRNGDTGPAMKCPVCGWQRPQT